MSWSKFCYYVGALLKPSLVLAAAAATLYGAGRMLIGAWRFAGDERRLRRQLEGKTVLITGASSGIGLALARLCHRYNARLVLLARSLDRLVEIRAELAAANPNNPHRVIYHYLDLDDAEAVAGAAESVGTTAGSVDVLINNAGVSVRASCSETNMAVHRRLMQVNYFGQLELTQALMPFMGEAAAIVVVASLQSRLAVAFRSAYSASKHALLAYFDSLRIELAAAGSRLTVHTILPGYVKTSLADSALSGSGGSRYAAGSEKSQSDEAHLKGAMSPEYVAREILLGWIRGEQHILLAPLTHRLAVYVSTLFPALIHRFLVRRAKSELKHR